MEIIKQIEQSFKTSISFPCSYIKGNSEKRIYIDLKNFKNKTSIISKLSRSGFRRSYNHMYIPQCKDCSQCTSSRINKMKFLFTKGTKRNLKKNSDLKISVNTKNFEKERFELFINYCSERHNSGNMQFMNFEEFNNFYHHNQNKTIILDLIDNHNVLFASILLDVLDDGYSAVYSFFNPFLNKRGLGKNLILRSLELLIDIKKKYLYLGYWIKDCTSMNYKSSFKGVEFFINGKWQNKP